MHYGAGVDVYSFGIVMWELATRQTPWSELDEGGGNSSIRFFTELNLALQTGRRPPLTDSITVVCPLFVGVMRRCWAGDPADRPSFSDAATDLAACLRAEYT